MDLNHNFLDWVFEQSELGLDGQLGEPPKIQADPFPDLLGNINANSDSTPFSISFNDDGSLVNDDSCLDMFLAQDPWNHNSELLSSPTLQFGGSSGSSTSGSSDSDDKDTMRSRASPSRNIAIHGVLKPFILDDAETPRTSNHRTMPATGRLDFRVTTTTDCKVSDSELKKMTSKERRQFRNKISARNFRQRRKDFITSLEEQIEGLESEKAQLKLEVTKVYEIVDKLKKENDQLREELTVARQSVVTAPVTALSAAPQPLVTNNTDESTISMWDSFLRDSTWLSHAAIPQWDFSHILTKDQERPPFSSSLVHMPAREAFSRYPLLGPALMSIVLDHTMGLSADELIKLTAGIDSDKSTKAYLPLTFETMGDRGVIEEVKEEDSEDDEDQINESDDEGDAGNLDEPPAEESSGACIKSWLKKNICCKPPQAKEPAQTEQPTVHVCAIRSLSYWVASYLSHQLIECGRQISPVYSKTSTAVETPSTDTVAGQCQCA